ncbi:PDZ domain-containing protein [Marmoricola sp. OAE513]|uniref:YlbL family protein n=1 Tax=Marmoricola sp. OAE513 TaxID=2817894 RepID=UPI001AE23B1B
MSRRTVAGLLALGLAAALLVVAVVMPVPYVTFRPGPTINVLAPYDGKDIIQITGRKVYKDDGALRMVTVYPTGPKEKLSFATVLAGWFSTSTAVLPRGAVYQKQDTAKSVQQESALQMTTSQDNATVAALDAAGITYKTSVLVGQVDPKGASAGVLEVGDELLRINGTTITSPELVQKTIRPLPDRSKVTFDLLRKGKKLTVSVRTRASEIELPAPTKKQETCPDGSLVQTASKKVSLIGITPAPRYTYPFDVKVNLSDNIGGPSAGMMFALSIYDLLTPGSLTGGKIIAGSGEISEDGVVGAIGGIGQKLVGAQRDGAHLFLVAAENWQEAIHSDYDRSKLKLVKVHTIDDALKAIKAYRENPDAAPKGCS